MVVLVRYVLLLAFGVGLLLTFIGASVATTHQLIYSSPYPVRTLEDVGFWLLAGFTTLVVLACCKAIWIETRAMIFHLALLPDWLARFYDQNRERLATFAVGAFACAIFVVS